MRAVAVGLAIALGLALFTLPLTLLGVLTGTVSVDTGAAVFAAYVMHPEWALLWLAGALVCHVAWRVTDR